MKYLGIDFGTKNLGLAVSDEMGIIAGKCGTIKRKGIKSDLARLKEIIRQEGVRKIVIGYPKNMDGSSGNAVERVEGFISALERELNISIEKWDERLSSVSAEKLLIYGDVSRGKRKKVIDQVSAVIILQNYLDSQNSSIR